jgi:hypothetical protein
MTRDQREARNQEFQQATDKSIDSLHDLYAGACEIHPFFHQGNSLHATITSNEPYAEITKLAKALFPTDAGSVYLCGTSPEDKSIEAVVSWPASPRKKESLPRDDCWALKRGQVHLVDADHCQALFCNHVLDSACSSYLCVPMRAAGEVLGVFHLRTGTQGRDPAIGERTRLSEAKKRLAVAVANYIAPAIANLRSRELATRVTTSEYQVQKAGLQGSNWTTVCRGPEAKAREMFRRQLRLYSVGRFRLLDARGQVIEERKATPFFIDN